jgi:hypothetical protein
MITISAGLRTEIEKLRGRRLFGRVRIDYSDANIDATIIAWANTIAEHTYPEQVFNGKEDVTHKYISFDGQWVLDGTWYLPPETETEKARGEIGWWGHERSLESGSFSNASRRMYGEKLYSDSLYSGLTETFPNVNVNFLPRTISDIRVSFDNAREEYAVDFDVVLLGADYSELDRITVTGNAGYKYITSISPVNSVSQICLFVYKWSKGMTQAKCAEMFTSISELYEGQDLISFSTVENRELPEEGVPLGSTAAGECTITLFNRSRLFDFDNTTSKLFNVIREGVRIKPYIGDGTEWIPLGVFYAKTWDVPKNGITATVTGLDRMALLAESEYKTNQIIQAPESESHLIDTAGEWNAGDLVGVVVSTNSLVMVF